MTLTSITPSKSVSKRTSAVFGALVAATAILVQTTGASAVSLSVQRACMSDYFAYCSSHAVGSSSLRRCMSNAGPNLSKSCVNALIAAGEVSKSEVARRSASR